MYYSDVLLRCALVNGVTVRHFDAPVPTKRPGMRLPGRQSEKKAGHAKISKRHHRSLIVSAQSPTPSATVIVLLYEHVNTACLWNLCDSDTP